MYKKIKAYFKAHVCYNSTVHFLAGMGVGVLVTYPYVRTHPLRVGVALLGLALLGHLYPLLKSK